MKNMKRQTLQYAFIKNKHTYKNNHTLRLNFFLYFSGYKMQKIIKTIVIQSFTLSQAGRF